jgi:hypothetical protein
MNPKKNLVYGTHRVGRVLCLFSSRRNWDSPIPSPAVCPLPPVLGGGHTHWRERGWESPNSEEGIGTVVLFIYMYFEMGHHAGADYNITLCRLQHIMAILCQSRLYLGFGLCTVYNTVVIVLACCSWRTHPISASLFLFIADRLSYRLKKLVLMRVLDCWCVIVLQPHSHDKLRE